MKVTGDKQPQVRYGKIKRAFSQPFGWHAKIKLAAASNGLSASEFYSQIIETFVDNELSNTGPADYLLPGKDSEIKTILLRELVVHKVKLLATRDFIAENRVMFTAMALFAKKEEQL